MAELPLVNLDEEEEEELPLVELPLVDLDEPPKYLYNESGTVKGINPEWAKASKEKQRKAVRGTLASLQQGQLLGFEDEIVGAGRALADTLFADDYDFGEGMSDKSQGFGDKYRMYRDDQRDMRKEFAEENRGLATGLEVAGAFMTPGLGVAGSGATRLSRAANALNKGTQGAGKGAQAITRGAVEGGVAAAGASEAETADELAKDIMKGSAFGAGATGLFRATGAGLSAANKRRVAEDLVDPVTGVRKPIHLTDSGPGGLMRVIGRVPGAKGRLAAQEEPFVQEVADKLVAAKDDVVNMTRRAQDLGTELTEAREAIDLESAAEELLTTSKASKLSNARQQRFQGRALQEATPTTVDLPMSGNLGDDADRIANWWQNNGFREVKDNYFEWNKDFTQTDLARKIKERIKGDADLRLELDNLMPKIQQMQDRLRDPTTDLATKTAPDLGSIAGAASRQKRLPGEVGNLVDDLAEEEFISGEALMAIRNVFATGANGRSKSGYPLRRIANEFDDYIRDQFKKQDKEELVDLFDQQLSRYTTALTVQGLKNKPKVIERGWFTPGEWLTEAKRYAGSGMSTKKPPLKSAAKVAGQRANEAKESGPVLQAAIKRSAAQKKSALSKEVKAEQTRLRRAAQDSKRKGAQAEAEAAVRDMASKTLPQNSSLLSEMLSAEFLGGLSPSPIKGRTVKAIQGIGIGRGIASDAVQDMLAGQAKWQNELRAAIMRGDYERVTRILSREIAREQEEP